MKMYFLLIYVLWAILPGNAVHGMDEQYWRKNLESRDDRTKARDFMNEGFYDRAKPLLEAELNKKRDSECLYLMGCAEHGLGNNEEAETYYEEALSQDGVSETMKSRISAKLKAVQEITKKNKPCD